MNQKRSLGSQIVHSILYGRFEPVETILALFLATLGIWVSIREYLDSTTFLFGSGAEFRVIAFLFGVFGLFHIIAMYYSQADGVRWMKWRCNSMFGITLIFLFATIEIIFQSPVGEARWLNWAALTLISGATYLALVVKRN